MFESYGSNKLSSMEGQMPSISSKYKNGKPLQAIKGVDRILRESLSYHV